MSNFIVFLNISINKSIQIFELFSHSLIISKLLIRSNLVLDDKYYDCFFK